MTSNLGYNYLGTLDDSVERFPWSFKMTEKRLNHSLAIQLITGRPILLNDGYLIQNSLCIKAITDRESLLWALIDSGFISIMSRGYGQFSLQEMPVRMSEFVQTMRMLINDELPGVPPWTNYKKKLEDVDRRMRAINNFVPWPKYDTGSGYSVLANRLLDRNSTLKSLGISALHTDAVFQCFLKEFVDILRKDLSAPRTKWEQLAKKYSDNPNYAKNAKKAHQELMVLANEIYHYNVGIMLSGSTDMPISVETQTSQAFDDLLVINDIVLDEVPDYPRLQVPLVVTTANPRILAQILDTDRPVGEARVRWLKLEQKVKLGEFADKQTLHDAAEEYAKRLSEHLGLSVRYKEGEGLISFIASKALALPREAVLLGTAAAASSTSAQLGLPVEIAGLTGIAAGYVMSKIQKNMIGSVIKKVRIQVLKDQFLSESDYRRIFEKSSSTINSIMNREVPCSIDMDTRQAQRLLSQYKIFCKEN